MMAFHFLRPWWLLAFTPLAILVGQLLRQKSAMGAWQKVCDNHLLPYLIQTKNQRRRLWPLLSLFISGIFLVISLAGPTWSRLPVPTYQQIQPRVLVLDMSDAMLERDLSPDRLRRAKFKLHDLLKQKDIGQLGLVVYAGEPFVASPMTDDGDTIDALLDSLTPDVMPVEGDDLAGALDEAAKLIAQAGFHHGQVLVLSASPPSANAIEMAGALAKAGVDTSIMPVLPEQTTLAASFKQFAEAGLGEVIPFVDSSADINQWVSMTKHRNSYTANADNEVPIWRDQGRWFLVPALLLLLPVFRRGWTQGIGT